jgi:hypothetical protein
MPFFPSDSRRYESGNFKFPLHVLGFPTINIRKFSLFMFVVSEAPQTCVRLHTYSQRQVSLKVHGSTARKCGLSGLQPCEYRSRIQLVTTTLYYNTVSSTAGMVILHLFNDTRSTA